MSGFGLDPGRQPFDSPKHDSSGGADSLVKQRYRVAVVDAQGCEHCGQAILAGAWCPSLAELDPGGSEEFRIVILTQPVPEPPEAVAAGVAVCTPSGPDFIGEGVLQETAVAYEVRGSEEDVGAQHEPEADAAPLLTLSAQEMAALAGGQILAMPPLEISPADIFPPEETRPRLEVLAQALIEQQAARPYLRALAAALAAPAATTVGAQHAAPLRELLLRLDTVLQEARGQAACFSELLARSPQVAEALERLAAMSQSTTTEAFLGTVSCLYASASDPSANSGQAPSAGSGQALAEDVYLCRALGEKPEQGIEVARMRAFLAQAVVPESAPQLAIDRTIALEQMSFAAIAIGEPHRLASMRATWDWFRQRYQAAYGEHHQRYWREALDVHAQLMDIAYKAYALRRLNTLAELGPPVGESALAEYEELPARIGGCPRAIKQSQETGGEARCPTCGISMVDEPPWQQAQEVKHRLERALSQQLQRLSSKAVRQILASSGQARVEEFLQVVQASQVQALASILDDELLGFLRRFLVEGRVQSLLAPLLAKLQDPAADMSEEELKETVNEMGRVLNDAFAASQRALPEEHALSEAEGTWPQLSLGPGQSEAAS